MLIRDHKKAKRKQAREKRRLEYQDRRMANDAEHAKVTRAMRYDVLRRDDFHCVRCGRGRKDGVKLHVDHIVPVSPSLCGAAPIRIRQGDAGAAEKTRTPINPSLVAYYAKRKDKALEDGDKRLAVRYARLEEAERIARSGKLSDRESALLSPGIAFICLHAGGLVAECGYCGCVVDEKWDFCARCGAHFMDRRYVAEFGDLDV